MNERDKLRSDSLNLLRFPLAIVILVIHVFSTRDFKLHGQLYSLDSTPIFKEINFFIDGFLRSQSVPIYFFISGYVFFLGVTLTKDVYIRKLHNRVKSLFIPYIIWNTLAVLIGMMWFLPVFEQFFPNLSQVRLDFSLPRILNCYWDIQQGIFVYNGSTIEDAMGAAQPADRPLWFLRDLMIVVLTTPAIYWILKHTKHYFVVMLGILWYIVSTFHLYYYTQLPAAYFFFTFGAYMSVNRKDMLVEFGKHFRLSAILYVFLSLLYVGLKHYQPELCIFIKHLNIFVGLIFAYNLSTWLLEKHICRPSSFLSSASFFIYISHGLICINLHKLIFHIAEPTSDWGMLFVYCSTVIITVAILLSTFWLLRQYTPALLKVIAGRK